MTDFKAKKRVHPNIYYLLLIMIWPLKNHWLSLVVTVFIIYMKYIYLCGGWVYMYVVFVLLVWRGLYENEILKINNVLLRCV